MVSGETPPQSSMPAASNGARSSLRFGGACRWTSAGRIDPRRGDRPEELVGRARLGAVHRGAGLGQEVLHDHFLHVTVLEVRVRDRDERVDALGARLADADEDAGGERDAGPARGVQRGEPPRRGLVGRAEVRAAGLVQPVGERLDHHPLRRADGAQAKVSSASESAPALAWGSRPVSSSTRLATAAR